MACVFALFELFKRLSVFSPSYHLHIYTSAYLHIANLSRHRINNIVLCNDLNLTLFILNQYGDIFLIDH